MLLRRWQTEEKRRVLPDRDQRTGMQFLYSMEYTGTYRVFNVSYDEWDMQLRKLTSLYPAVQVPKERAVSNVALRIVDKYGREFLFWEEMRCRTSSR